ncbi:MAG TPA: hypothetical protein DCE25_07630 [Pseudomonas sp.]|nr:hypothetical protein [Pseudomonas sp.]
MPAYTVSYALDGQPSTHTFELEQGNLALHEVAMHLIVLHFGDSENSLLLPPADATPVQVLAQAEVLGITEIAIA